MIKPIKQFSECLGYAPLNLLIKKVCIPGEIEFPLGNFQSGVNVSLEISVKIWFGLSRDVFDTRFLKLVEGPKTFLKDELMQIAESFNFRLRQNILHPELLVGYLENEHEYSPIYAAFQSYSDRYFMMIYGARKVREALSAGEDAKGDNIIYIHGIWEVEVSKDLIERMF